MEGISNSEFNPDNQSQESLTTYAQEKRNLIMEEAEALKSQQEAKRRARELENDIGRDITLDSLLESAAKYKEEIKNSPEKIVQSSDEEEGFSFGQYLDDFRGTRGDLKGSKPQDVSFESAKKIIRHKADKLVDIATTYSYTGEIEKASEIIEMLEAANLGEKDRSVEKSAISLAGVSIDSGDFEMAEKLFNKISSEKYLHKHYANTQTLETLNKFIESLIKKGDKEKAISFADSHGDKKDVFSVVCRALVETGNTQEAQDIIFQLDGENKVFVSIETIKALLAQGNKEAAEALIIATEKEVSELSFPPESDKWERDRNLYNFKTTLPRLREQLTNLVEPEVTKETDFFDQAIESAKIGNFEEAVSFYDKAPGQLRDREEQKKTEELLKKGLTLDKIKEHGLAVSSRGELSFSMKEKAIEAGYQIALAYQKIGDKEKENKYFNSILSRYAYNNPKDLLKKIWESGNEILVHKFLRSKFRTPFQTIDSQGTILPWAGMAGNTRRYSEVVGNYNESTKELLGLQLFIGDFDGAEKTDKYCFYERSKGDLAVQQAIKSYQQLQELKKEGVDLIDIPKVLQGAVETEDQPLIESLGVIMTDEERNKVSDTLPKEIVDKLTYNRGLAANIDKNNEYENLLKQTKELLSDYVHNGDREDVSAVKKMVESLDNLAPEEAADLIGQELKSIDVENPHAVRLLKYLLDNESPQGEQIALSMLRQKSLPERHFEYIAEKLLSEDIHSWSDNLTGVFPPAKEIIAKVKSTDPILHSYLVKRLLNNKIIRPEFPHDKSDYAQNNAKEIIILNINDFHQLDSEVARALDGYSFHKSGSKITFKVNDYLRSFKDLDSNVALEIIAKGRASQVLMDIDSFLPFDSEKFNTFFDQQVEKKDWKKVAELSQFDVCKEKFNKLFDEYKKFAEDTSEHFSLRQDAINFLVSLAKEGAVSIEEEFISIIQERSKQKYAPESKWSLDPAQEAAFYALMRLDNQRVNEALFRLLINDNVSETVKQAVVRKLIRKERDFSQSNVKSSIAAWSANNKEKGGVEWNDLTFINAINTSIPSTELKERSLLQILPHTLIDHSETGSIYKSWKENYKNIPENTFLQLRELLTTSIGPGISAPRVENDKLLSKFQSLYKGISKEGSRKDDLLFGIVNCLVINENLYKVGMDRLSEIDFGIKGDDIKVSKILRQFSFLDKLGTILEMGPRDDYGGHYYDDYEDYGDDDYEPDQNVAPLVEEKTPKEESKKDILIREVETAVSGTNSLSDMESVFGGVITEKIKEILPHPDITSEKIEAVEKKWGDLEPIFTYAGRYPEISDYVAEIVTKADTRDSWKAWRYDKEDASVEEQIGSLKPEQLSAWASDYSIELGDLDLNESEGTKPQEIRNILIQAVVDFKHINDVGSKDDKHSFIQNRLEAAFKKVSEQPGEADVILGEEIEKTEEISEQFNVLIQSKNIPQYRQILQTSLAEGVEVTISSKTKNVLSLISNILSSSLRKDLSRNYQRESENKSKVSINAILTPEMREYANQRMEEIEKQADLLNSGDKFAGLINPTETKDLKSLYEKRSEISTLVSLMRLANLTNRSIAINKLEEQETKGGESLSVTLKNLQKYFENTPFELDVKNIESKIHEKKDIHHTRKIVMMFTDDPQMLWQVGKYPLGNGSCQHYAEGSYADKLMGYVGDANCKVAFMVDINSLPQEFKDKYQEGIPVSEFMDVIPKQDVLRAVVARSLIKLGKSEEGNTAIVIEPTYTNINKGDRGMDAYFDRFAKNFIANTMDAGVYRSGGGEKVVLGESRHRLGQYEDLNLNSLVRIN